MKKYLTLLLSFTLLSISIAQKHDYIWMFGNGGNFPNQGFGTATMDFNTIPPTISTDYVNLPFSSTACTFSDSSGQLLFYTNGIKIMNKNFQLMENGDSINFGEVWDFMRDNGYITFFGTQALPDPLNSNGVYLFHMGLEIGTDLYYSPFYYSYIDLSKSQGLGAVTLKNEILLEGNITPPVAVKHGNGRDWWLITGDVDSTNQYVYLIDKNGISDPLVFHLGPSYQNPEWQSTNAISPNGELYIRNDLFDGMRLFDFNRCTGELSNVRIQPESEPAFKGAITFSPNGEYLYLTEDVLSLYQINVASLDSTTAEFDSIAYIHGGTCGFSDSYSFFHFGGLAPDGKIYNETFYQGKCLNIIHSPNLPIEAADIEQHGLYLGRYNDYTIYRFPNYRLGRWLDSPCDTIQLLQIPSGFTDTHYDATRFENPNVDPIRYIHWPQELLARKEKEEKEKGRFSLRDLSLELLRKNGGELKVETQKDKK